MLYELARKALFATDPETAHELTLESLRLGHRLGATRFLCKAHSQPVRCMGLDFPNPVGVAPGLDKNGDYFEALGDLGFGFVEIGTVTPRPQPGNPRPRVFRLERAQGMINRLGFNNKGVDHLVRRVRRHRYRGVLGINIGKNFDTPIERAVDDYLHCLDKIYPYADYVTVNVSSPNTQNLRDLQGKAELGRLLAAVAERRAALAEHHGRYVPLAVKIAPDLEDVQILAIAKVVAQHAMDAVIATNTTISREGVEGMQHANEAGGLSGPSSPGPITCSRCCAMPCRRTSH
jgi:dihydroorotate dehydrogenase